eukprot:ANDGO_00218.mRNA.1 myosin
MSARRAARGSAHRWKKLDDGSIEGFTLSDCRSDLVSRVELHGPRLYSIEECKTLLSEVIRVITVNASHDFELLNYLDKFRTAYCPELPSISVERLDELLPCEPADFAASNPEAASEELAHASAAADTDKVAVVARELHIQIIRVIDGATMLRRKRIFLMNQIYKDLEALGYTLQ